MDLNIFLFFVLYRKYNVYCEAGNFDILLSVRKCDIIFNLFFNMVDQCVFGIFFPCLME